MSYFKNFPLSFYSFGDSEESAVVQNIATYVDILDDIKVNSAFYQDYYVQGGERPDQTAFTLYRNPHMHWTFYLMNDKIREQGWPLEYSGVVEKAKSDYSNFTITTTGPIHDAFNIGSTITGGDSNATGTIVHKNLNLGQIVVKLSSALEFHVAEVAICEGDIVTVTGASKEYLAANHYVLNNERVDLDLSNMSVPLGAVPKTNLDFYVEENDKLKQIRVIKPSSINTVQALFNEALRS